jgi:hypothetical protein
MTPHWEAPGQVAWASVGGEAQRRVRAQDKGVRPIRRATWQTGPYTGSNDQRDFLSRYVELDTWKRKLRRTKSMSLSNFKRDAHDVQALWTSRTGRMQRIGAGYRSLI